MVTINIVIMVTPQGWPAARRRGGRQGSGGTACPTLLVSGVLRK